MSTLTGTGALFRLALRRERLRVPLWTLACAATTAGAAAATADLYPSQRELTVFAEAVNAVPALVAFYGRIYDPTSLGAAAVLKLTGFGAALIALLLITTVVRHTRAEEESGRLDLLGSGVVGRHAPLAAALAVTVVTGVAVGILTAGGLAVAGLPVAGSVALGAGWMTAGWAFGAIAAVAAQLCRSARLATGIAGGVLGLAYLLRAIGDSGPEWLSWLSPIGWAQQIRPFAGERWWVVALPVAFAAVLLLVAVRLSDGRDLGAGLLADRAGPAHAGRGLQGTTGLLWRLNRAGLLAWTAVYLVLGLVIGNLANGIGKFLDNPRAEQLILALGGQKALADAFFALEFGVAGIIAAVYAMSALTHLHAEEEALRTEPLLATSVSRTRLLSGHLVLATAGSAVPLLAAGLGAGFASGLQSGNTGAEIGRLTATALVQLPAVWVLAGVACALFGLLPSRLGLVWVVLVAVVVVGEFGVLLGVPQVVLNLSPFTHLPSLPGSTEGMTSIPWLVLVAGALFAAGVAGFRRRDIAA
ncbi:ABC transporter permease [Amycolatopsis sp. CB00013]|uniref:ABC transporter permease n=1 Tax=Amycolatopsis sp. CB00013 TaxID=1703945 RepID=UPI00093ECAF6|nr:ABC transporter permease [Amycolatopsis sp. CB00013]OKK01332.1 ABC transporter permease [Amycolatopsis sp. CB00013]